MTELTLPTNHQFRNLSGCKFGKLTVIGFAGKRGQRVVWACRCECGNESVVITSGLNSGKTKSCGCLQREIVRCRQTTHGKSHTTEYKAWFAMIERCHNPSNPGYEGYGAKGIYVCEEWRESFENFLRDMGMKPTARHSIDRFPNQTGPYDPSNCRWATQSEQHENRCCTQFVEVDGVKMLLTEAAKSHGLEYATVRTRIKRGWSADRIFANVKHSRKQALFS
jgi:hypothetical protein